MCSVNEIEDSLKVGEEKAQSAARYEIFSMIPCSLFYDTSTGDAKSISHLYNFSMGSNS